MRSNFQRPYCNDSVNLPAKYAVCPDCNGSGTELYGSLKGAAFSASDIDEDPEFFEDYMNGNYDVVCSCCHGRTTIPVFDVQNMTYAEKRIAATIRKEQREKAHADYCDAQQRRAESGYYS